MNCKEPRTCRATANSRVPESGHETRIEVRHDALRPCERSRPAGVHRVFVESSGTLPSYGKAGWGRGFLPSDYQGVRCSSDGDPVLYLTNPEGMDQAPPNITPTHKAEPCGSIGASHLAGASGDREWATCEELRACLLRRTEAADDRELQAVSSRTRPRVVPI